MKIRKSAIKEILAKYNLGDLKTSKLIYNEWNIVYHLITTKGEYSLKILKFQSEDILKKELNILKVLKDKIPCILPVLSKGKQPYLNYKGGIVLIKPFVKGHSILMGKRLSMEILTQLGKYYALIHKTRNINNIPKKDLYKYLLSFFKNIDKNSEEYKIARLTFSRLKDNNFTPSKYPKGLIHADLHTENILVKDNKIVSILDFEDSHIGTFIYDLGIGILDACWENNHLSKQRIKSFIKGYKKIRRLTKEEEVNLVNAVLLAGVYTLHFLIIKNGISNKNMNYYIIKRLRELLKKEDEMKKDVFKKTTSIRKRFEKMNELMKPFLKKYKKLVIVHAVHDLKTFQKILNDKKLKLPSKHDTEKKSKYMERLLGLDNSIFYSVGFVYVCAYEFNYNLIFDLEFLKKTEYYKNSIAYKIYQKIARYWYDHDREYLEKLANKNKTCREVIDKYLNKEYKGKKLKLLDFWRIEKEFFKSIMDYPNKRYLIKIAKIIQNHLKMKYPYSIRYVKDHYNSSRVPEVIGREDNNLIDNPHFLGFYIKGRIPKTLMNKIKKDYKGKILFNGKKIEVLK